MQYRMRPRPKEGSMTEGMKLLRAREGCVMSCP